MRTNHLQLVTHEHSATIKSKSDVLSPYGPVNPASTTLLAQETLRANQEARLTELLNSLERKIAELNSKSYEALNILISGTVPPAKRGTSFSSTSTTSVLVSKS